MFCGCHDDPDYGHCGCFFVTCSVGVVMILITVTGCFFITRSVGVVMILITVTVVVSFFTHSVFVMIFRMSMLWMKIHSPFSMVNSVPRLPRSRLLPTSWNCVWTEGLSMFLTAFNLLTVDSC